VELLRGGKKHLYIDGKRMSQTIDTYKSQLASLTDDPLYTHRISQLKFEKPPIIELIREINHEQPSQEKTNPRKIKFQSRSHFGLEVGFSANTIFRPFVFRDPGDFDPPTYVAHSWLTGVYYKRRIGMTRSYLSSGVQYEHMPATTAKESRIIDSGPDTVARRDDHFFYELNSINVSVAFNPEILHGKIRPYADVGVGARIFIKREISSTQRLYENDRMIAEERIPGKIPPWRPMVRWGGGCRFLIDMNRSISVGIYTEGFQLSQKTEHIEAMRHRRIYLVYGF